MGTNKQTPYMDCNILHFITLYYCVRVYVIIIKYTND